MYSFQLFRLIRLQQETEKDDLSGTLSSALLTSVEKRLPLNGENICAALLDPSMRKLNAIEDYLRENGTNSTELLKAMAEAYAVVEENTDVFTENITVT